jgi:hypothetical protein
VQLIAKALSPHQFTLLLPSPSVSLSFSCTETAEEVEERALSQRPDLLEQIAKVRAADASINEARSECLPFLSFLGLGGIQRAYGQQDLLPGTYAAGDTWNVQLNLQWTLFDGGQKERRSEEAKASGHRQKPNSIQYAMRSQIRSGLHTLISKQHSGRDKLQLLFSYLRNDHTKLHSDLITLASAASWALSPPKRRWRRLVRRMCRLELRC